MKVQIGLETWQIVRMLETALDKEQEACSTVGYSLPKNNERLVCPESRDAAVRWLISIAKKLKLHPETVALSVSVLDRFLNVVKVQLKYLKVIGVACLFVSAKIQEEDKMIPGALEMVRESGCGCSVAELLRMERVILDKLNWDIQSATVIDFTHLFHSLLMSNYPQLLVNCAQMTPGKQLTLLTRKVQNCLAYHGLLAFKPSVVALSILSLELELFCSDWFIMTTRLQNMAKIDSESMMLCREKVMVFLSSIAHSQTIYLQTPAKHSAPQANSIKASKRKVKHIEQDDDFYDAIKRLYNEEETFVNNTSCSSEVIHDMVVPVQTLVK